MTSGEPDPIPAASLLAGLVPDDVRAGYEKLLAAEWVTAQDAADFLGDDVMRSLKDLGMADVLPATPSRPARFRPTRPPLALLGALARLQARVLHDQELLLDGQRRLADIEADASGLACSDSMVEVITDGDEISDLTRHLVNSARRDWMTLETADLDLPLSEEFAIDSSIVTQGLTRVRSIYTAAFARHPLGQRMIRSFLDAGEQARVLPSIPAKMQIADRHTALLALTSTGTGGAVLIRSQPVVVMLRDHFEFLWQTAAPAGLGPADPASPLTKTQQAIIGLMALGMQDEAIARQLDVSLTTVRRQVKAMMKLLRVSSRFALGAAMARRGWIGQPDQPGLR
jgi:DNA-binding CsgD family transcriptional regulator